MTTVKRLGVASMALISVGAAAAYYTTSMAMQGHGVLHGSVNYLVMGLAAALTVLVLTLYWRSVHRAVKSVADQLRQMTAKGELDTIHVAGGNELAPITKPLNDFLQRTRQEVDQLRAQSRELQIQARISAAEKHHTEAIILSIRDAVIVTNRFDELVLANEAAERLLGFKLAGALRKSIERVLVDGTLVRLVRETRSQGKSFMRKVVEHTIDRKGEPRIFSITLSCVMGLNDDVSGVVAVLHDVTREKEIAQMKTDFVSNVSHELKTPLASIKAYVEMLVDGEAQDDQTRGEFYDIISAETERLHRLIENILNISRIESGVVKVVKEAVSITGIAKQVLDVVAPQAKAKQITLHDQLAPVFFQIEADHDMVYQAVMNLVSNALKYTPAGGDLTVGVGMDEARRMAIFEVSDTGMGIPAEDLPHVFDKFYRVQANKKMAKGTGLGLTLVKHIVETVHDGKLSVTSEVGKGSTFTIELPVLD